MFRSRKLLDHAYEHSCQACGQDNGTTVAAHSNQGRHGKGLGIKAHDCFVAYLCGDCHYFVDFSRSPNDVRTAVWQLGHVNTLPLIERFLNNEARALLAAAA